MSEWRKESEDFYQRRLGHGLVLVVQRVIHLERDYWTATVFDRVMGSAAGATLFTTLTSAQKAAEHKAFSILADIIVLDLKDSSVVKGWRTPLIEGAPPFQPFESDHPIPPMDHPDSKYWDQPKRESIKIDGKIACMDQKTFDALHTYSASYPSGVYEGKMWKRESRANKWVLCWYGPGQDAGTCSVYTRSIQIDRCTDRVADEPVPGFEGYDYKPMPQQEA
jgi:hypothetical protein